MIKIVTSVERHTSEKGWIHSEFSFSFADYDDPSNSHFGCLLALNDNQLQPQEGFKKHPHHDLEIVSLVISGTLQHEDDLGNQHVLEAGTVQVMSAGTGDAARIHKSCDLHIKGSSSEGESEFILVDLP